MLDELVPPAIRDRRWFMWPLFYLWFRGKNVRRMMDFKSQVYGMSREELRAFYRERDSLATRRPTDLTEASLARMLARLLPDARSLLDVGCGQGYFLERVARRGLRAYGCDVVDAAGLRPGTYVQAEIDALPFRDGQFDVVTCSHTLEHVIDLPAAVRELRRVARRQLVVVVPCQRWHYYTLDEHVQFFPRAEMLVHAIGLPHATCEKVAGDWLYTALLPLPTGERAG